MAKAKKSESNSITDIIERLLGTKNVLAVDLDDVGVILGDRKFSFSGKLRIGPVVAGESAKKRK